MFSLVSVPGAVEQTQESLYWLAKQFDINQARLGQQGAASIDLSAQLVADLATMGLAHAPTGLRGAVGLVDSFADDGARLLRTAGVADAADMEALGQISRQIAAQDIRVARQLFQEAGVSRSSANEVIRSFDLEGFRVMRTDAPEIQFRFFDDFNAGLKGRFVTPDFIEGQTDRIVQLALPKNAATRIGQATIPSDSFLLRGIVAPQPRFSPGLTGGAEQSFILGDLNRIRFAEAMR